MSLYKVRVRTYERPYKHGSRRERVKAWKLYSDEVYLVTQEGLGKLWEDLSPIDGLHSVFDRPEVIRWEELTPRQRHEARCDMDVGDGVYQISSKVV